VLQLRQRWSGNEALWAALQKDRRRWARRACDYFWLNKGPWSIIDDNRSFMPAEVSGIADPGQKPEGANFYPEGASKQALETWMNACRQGQGAGAVVLHHHPRGRRRQVQRPSNTRTNTSRAAAAPSC
jgi:hypothetical protein